MQTIKLTLFIFALLTGSILGAQEALSPRIANYHMEVTLDIDQKIIRGSTELLWKNISTDTVDELQFHLYYNAFKNTRSTFMREIGNIPSFFTESLLEDCGWSWSEILEIMDEDGNDLSGALRYIQPDDNNVHDQTVLSVPLARPVPGGDSITVTFDWEAKIPKSMIRTGYNKDYYFFAQWFPKVGVYEPAGMRGAIESGWNCHQYHSNGEYYSDFGAYEVELRVPSDFIVGASGELLNKIEDGEMSNWVFHAADVIDFTWTASPEFMELKSKWRDVEITLLTYADHLHAADRYFTTIHHAFEYMDAHVGKYPYKTLTIVNAPIHGIFTGGMEYPTLISSFNVGFFPQGLRTMETLTTHEFIHQYFMQLVATNEQEEPWMDEGITTYYEGRIIDHYGGEKESLANSFGLRVGNAEFNRAEYFGMRNPKIADNTYESWEYVHGGYGTIAYNKAALWLQTLEGLVGTPVMDEIMQTYFERWKFRHPGKQDFIDIVNEVVQEKLPSQFPEGMDWYFGQVLEGSELCDYAVAEITNERVNPDAGYLENTVDCVMPDLNIESKVYVSKIILHRLGEVQLPVEVHIQFEDGSVEIEHWDGKRRSWEFSYASEKKIISAEIDPERKIQFDANFLNNSLSVVQRDTGVNLFFARALTSLQHLMESLSLII